MRKIEMKKLHALSVLALVTFVSGCGASNHELRYPQGELNPNVSRENTTSLLSNAAYVSVTQSDYLRYRKTGGDWRVYWYGSNGELHECIGSNYYVGRWDTGSIEERRTGDLLPSKRHYILNKTYDILVSHNAVSGQHSTFQLKGSPVKRWERTTVGHLQQGIPAATWDKCPDFPSAEELGAPVNEAQTSRTYNGLVSQSPGTRILRPDLVSGPAL